MNNILDTMSRHGIGFNTRFFEQVQSLNSKYPPHNITQIGHNFRLTLAVAGFSENELDVFVQEDLLTISGKKEVTKYTDPDTYYALPHEKAVEADGEPRPVIRYRGIAFRDFHVQFSIGDVEIKSAVLKNGLLEIDLIRHIPEAKKPRQIEVVSS